MRKILTALIAILLLASCASKNSVKILELSTDKDFITNKRGKDSVVILVPRTFEIKNNSSQELRFYDVSYENIKYSSTDYIRVFDKNDSFRLLPPDQEFIKPFSAKQYLIYSPACFYPKSKLDTVKYSTTRIGNINLKNSNKETKSIVDSFLNLQQKESLLFTFQTKNAKDRYFLTYNFKDSTTVAKDEAELWEEYKKQKDEEN